MSKTILVDTKQIKFQIWDTAGQLNSESCALIIGLKVVSFGVLRPGKISQFGSNVL